jgi:hypothetical protein
MTERTGSDEQDENARCTFSRSTGSWSLGGGGVVEVAEGQLSLGALVVERDSAVLAASLRPSSRPGRSLEIGVFGVRFRLPMVGRRPIWLMPRLAGLTVTDDRQNRYTFDIAMAGNARRLEGNACAPLDLRLRLTPVPKRDVSWLDLCGPNGTSTRLSKPSQATVRMGRIVSSPGSQADQEILELVHSLILYRLAGVAPGKRAFIRERCSDAMTRASELHQAGLITNELLPTQLAKLCASEFDNCTTDGLAPEWASMLDAAKQSDGARLNIDLSVDLPSVDGTSIRLDSLISGPDDADSWRIYFRAAPCWRTYDEDSRRSSFLRQPSYISNQYTFSLIAEDNVGGSYLSVFDGSRRYEDYEEVVVRFRPRLNPVAHELKLTMRGPMEELEVMINLVLEEPLSENAS